MKLCDIFAGATYTNGEYAFRKGGNMPEYRKKTFPLYEIDKENKWKIAYYPKLSTKLEPALSK